MSTSNQFFLGAYWPARKESIDQCVDRLLGFFPQLALCDPVFSSWCETGVSAKRAREKPADIRSREYLVRHLSRRRNRRDSDRTVIEELGFRVDLWNGREEAQAVGLRIKCGLYWVSPTPGSRLSNCVTLYLPDDLGELQQAENMARVLGVIAKAWEPAWAGVMSRAAMDERDFDAGKPFVDWMLYLGSYLAPQIPKLSPPASVRQIGTLGSIIVVQPEPPEPANPDHQRNIHQVEAALQPARL